MTDTDPPIDPPSVIQLKGPDLPWYAKPAGALFVACVGLSFLLFAITATIGLMHANANNEQGRRERAEQAMRITEFETRDRRASEVEQAQQDCRDDRVDGLLRITSRIAGDTAHLFSQLAAQQSREQMQVTIDQLERLSQEREIADASLGVAIQECKNAVPGGS